MVLTAGQSADDLPVIRENFKKGFLETQTKVNSWFGNLKKQLNGDEDEEEEQAHSSQRYEQQTSAYGRPRRSGEMGRRSGDRERYDADPQVLSDDFSALELRDGESECFESGDFWSPLIASTSPSATPSSSRQHQPQEDCIAFPR